MADLEGWIQTHEQEHTTIKKTIELQAAAMGALVNKATLGKLNEKYDKLFETLMNHDRFINEQLAELRNQNTELDGKIVGLQTEMRQSFAQVDQRFAQVDQRFAQVDQRLDQIDQSFAQVDQRFDQIEATLGEQKSLLTAILARLPEK